MISSQRVSVSQSVMSSNESLSIWRSTLEYLAACDVNYAALPSYAYNAYNTSNASSAKVSGGTDSKDTPTQLVALRTLTRLLGSIINQPSMLK